VIPAKKSIAKTKKIKILRVAPPVRPIAVPDFQGNM
jgi:hypothetical protein